MDDTRLKKLKFRAWHRGFREADLILGPFADSHVQSLTPDQLDLFERLLEQPDPAFEEVGPGQVLTKLLKQIQKRAKGTGQIAKQRLKVRGRGLGVIERHHDGRRVWARSDASGHGPGRCGERF